ncbi:hypothetical protein GDO86_008259 [Hymenochirus boettgeri]|uniref:WAP four-disulfide core domain protein 1 n=1 Tax=Hymenochirus boettgeri TaxID=247094 RepID=A0A8T2IX10_9PIPI|nr:hypothetical protein GDO86_008259 [Hymenochirus boettgeri]
MKLWSWNSAWGRKVLFASLCIFLTLTNCCLSKSLKKRALYLKLSDKYDDYEYPLHPHNTKNDRCPPPPQSLPEHACEVPSCRSDSECERHKRCCYNGCIYSCLESVQPPPAEACSTTEDGDEPLHCPTGYECHIINPGSPAEGIPNRGQCIKQRGNSDGRNLRHKYYKENLDGTNNNVLVGLEKQPQKHLG